MEAKSLFNQLKTLESDDERCSDFFIEMTERLEKEQNIWHDFENQFVERLHRLKWMQDAHKELVTQEFNMEVGNAERQKLTANMWSLIKDNNVYYEGHCLRHQAETVLFKLLGTDEGE